MVEYTGPIQVKRGTTAEWASSVTPLREGEWGFDTVLKRAKLGDGATLWPGLGWAVPDASTIAQLQELADLVEGAVAPSDAVIAANVLTDGTATKQALSDTIGEVATDSTGRRVDSFPIPDARGIRAPLGDSYARGLATPRFRRAANHLLDQLESALPSLYNPVVIRMEGLIPNPLGRYYCYYSTNHDGGTGGIAMAYFNEPGEQMTTHGVVYIDTTEGAQTETPDIHWNADVSLIQYGAGLSATASTGRIAQVSGDLLVNGQKVRVTSAGSTGLSTSGVYYVVNATTGSFQLAGIEGGTPVTIAANSTVTLRLVGAFIMYYQQDVIATRGQQLTFYAYSRNGLTWTRGDACFTGTVAEGVLHTGYASIFRVGNRWGAYHLLASGAYPVFALSWSDDGISWWTDPRPLFWETNASGIAGTFDPNFWVAWHRCRPFLWNGQYWTFVTSAPFGVFGGQFASVHLSVAPLTPDFRGFAAPPVDCGLEAMLPTERLLADGPTNLVVADDGRMHGFYVSPETIDPNQNQSLTSLAVIHMEVPQ